MFLLCSDLAIRAGTAIKISPHNYDKGKRELRFNTKFGDKQTMPVTEEIAQIFAQVEKRSDTVTPYVQQLSRGGHMTLMAMQAKLRKLRKKLKITKQITFHDLRRTTAVEAFDITKDLRVVQALLGHRHLAATLHYLDHDTTPVQVSMLELAKRNNITEVVQ